MNSIKWFKRFEEFSRIWWLDDFSNANGDKYKDAAVNFWGKALSKKEARAYEKAKKKGDVKRMREQLQVPMGKVMPGFDELGDGKTAP